MLSFHTLLVIHCSLNCCVRICTCVKKDNQIALVAQKGLQECCKSNCVCHLDAVWQTLLNKNFQWSDTFTFTHNRLCGVFNFNLFNNERYQAKMRLLKNKQFCQFCQWLENLLQFAENESVIHSQAVLTIAVWLLCFISVHKHRTLSTVVKMESSNEWCTTVSQSYDCDVQAPAFWCKFICQIFTFKST